MPVAPYQVHRTSKTFSELTIKTELFIFSIDVPIGELRNSLI